MNDHNLLNPAVDDIVVAGAELKSAAFIIPLDAPLPNDLRDASVPSGGLLARLRYLGDEPIDKGFGFVPISGAEFLALERVWRTLQQRKHVYVLTDLPGAKQDVLFDQARRAIGLRALDWPSVSGELAAHVIQQQRTKDTTPWKAQPPASSKFPSDNDGRDDVAVPPPAEDDDAYPA